MIHAELHPPAGPADEPVPRRGAREEGSLCLRRLRLAVFEQIGELSLARLQQSAISARRPSKRAGLLSQVRGWLSMSVKMKLFFGTWSSSTDMVRSALGCA